ncbi:hypothetical protein Z043_114149 [Scleropages formosus]|uniref:Uncharacterized protein n=1 Tax=Scleropages formosus TaxID=113540 RepID=A0A0P7UZJ1_SCLFO|nr:hypothetical protein Z043_114149 [Scleropages formosus]
MAQSLEVTIDSSLCFSHHFEPTTWSSIHMLHKIHSIHPCVIRNSAQLLVQVTVISHLDDCNSLLPGLPSSSIQRHESCPYQIQHCGHSLNHQRICSPISTRLDRSLHPNQTGTLLHLHLLRGPTRKRSKIKSTKVFGYGSYVLE